jgi:hypothetical protein
MSQSHILERRQSAFGGSSGRMSPMTLFSLNRHDTLAPKGAQQAAVVPRTDCDFPAGGQHNHDALAPRQLPGAADDSARISAHRGRCFSEIVNDGGGAQVICCPGGLRFTAFRWSKPTTVTQATFGADGQAGQKTASVFAWGLTKGSFRLPSMACKCALADRTQSVAFGAEAPTATASALSE